MDRMIKIIDKVRSETVQNIRRDKGFVAAQVMAELKQLSVYNEQLNFTYNHINGWVKEIKEYLQSPTFDYKVFLQRLDGLKAHIKREIKEVK